MEISEKNICKSSTKYKKKTLQFYTWYNFVILSVFSFLHITIEDDRNDRNLTRNACIYYQFTTSMLKTKDQYHITSNKTSDSKLLCFYIRNLVQYESVEVMAIFGANADHEWFYS